MISNFVYFLVELYLDDVLEVLLVVDSESIKMPLENKYQRKIHKKIIILNCIQPSIG